MKIILEPLTPFFPEWYNADAHCEYHAGIPSHSTENCAPFKDEVQRLIKLSVLSFTVVKQSISGVVEKDIAMVLTTFNSYIDMDENAIECVKPLFDFDDTKILVLLFLIKLLSVPKMNLTPKTKASHRVLKIQHLGDRFESLKVGFESHRPKIKQK